MKFIFQQKLKKIDKLDEKIKKRIIEILRILKIDPIPAKFFDVKKLVGIENTYRIRLGKLRIVYSIIWEDRVILISRIGFRERVY